jgi:hypothetical protein
MKKLLFVLSAMTLLSYGCNRNKDTSKNTGGDIQREESRPLQTQGLDQDLNKASDEAQMEQERPGETQAFDRTKDTITEPLDERPDLEEDMSN